MADDDTTNELPTDQDSEDTLTDSEPEGMSPLKFGLAMMLWLMRAS